MVLPIAPKMPPKTFPPVLEIENMTAKEDFFTAIRAGDLKGVKRILGEFPNLINIKDDRGSTPLLLTTYYGHFEVAQFLLEQNAEVDAKDSSGNTALMGGCFKGYQDIAELLVNAGANVNHVNSMGATSLIYAATFNKVGIAKLLLEHGADINAKDGRGQSALDNAKMQEAQEMIDLLETYS